MLDIILDIIIITRILLKNEYPKCVHLLYMIADLIRLQGLALHKLCISAPLSLFSSSSMIVACQDEQL